MNITPQPRALHTSNAFVAMYFSRCIDPIALHDIYDIAYWLLP